MTALQVRTDGWLRPRFRHAAARGWMTTRVGGTSRGRYATMNVGSLVGDDPAAVAANRGRFADACRAQPAWLRQVHGATVVRVDRRSAAGPAPEADASVAVEPGVACVVQVADCLPVLFAAPDGRGVAAAHAGWRGLVAGVLEATVVALADAASCAPRDVDAWFGACIGPDAFEVGADVLAAFGADPRDQPRAFKPTGREGKWLADLPGLARQRLVALGVETIDTADAACTVADASRFFSFRRDGVTGRMAAGVWIDRRRGG